MYINCPCKHFNASTYPSRSRVQSAFKALHNIPIMKRYATKKWTDFCSFHISSPIHFCQVLNHILALYAHRTFCGNTICCIYSLHPHRKVKTQAATLVACLCLSSLCVNRPKPKVVCCVVCYPVATVHKSDHPR